MALTSMMSPTDLPIMASPKAQEFEILPLNGSLSTVPTIIYSASLPVSTNLHVTVEPKPTRLPLEFSSKISLLFKISSISLIRLSTSACFCLAAS